MAKRKTFDLGITVDRNTVFKLLNEMAARRVALFGLSGSGKSNTATVCVEGLITNGEQVVLIDPKGEGWGLRAGIDGDPAGGLDVVIFGEPHGDLPLRVEHAEGGGIQPPQPRGTDWAMFGSSLAQECDQEIERRHVWPGGALVTRSIIESDYDGRTVEPLNFAKKA